MITRAEIDRLKPNEKLEIIQIAWDSLVGDLDSLPVTEREKKTLRERSQAHQADPASSLSEEEFTEQLDQRLGRSR